MDKTLGIGIGISIGKWVLVSILSISVISSISTRYY